MQTSEPYVHFRLDSNDDHKIEVHRWQGGAAPRAVVQIAHGMGEHARRYRPLADALVRAGYVVYASEHRGHGADAAAQDKLGDFGPRGFAALADDMAVLSRHARAQHPGVPLILFGHSMGSFAAQCYLVEHSALLDGVSLSGTTAVDLMLAAAQAGFKLEDMNAGVPDSRTPFDWLSRDPAQVDAYIADPLCGFTVTPASRASMFTECARLAELETLRRIRPALPMYLFTGDCDPVNNHLAWFEPLVSRYRAAGQADVSSHVFGGARHETLNETNREEVVAVFIAWIERVVSSR
ncbi:alpha/beta fold hydrolase [Cupriavidus basilensis]|uniref:alpha/beta fold hydrolase n=1 Tax=Cupriavidus basilensis TaxID=68895 RepID=UPI0020A698C3|nr:alpha/beta fold hydrolase [Cupriavidus basilensis]MCP3023859.1 lysophospholipase [Cupriavidus basilensis]